MISKDVCIKYIRFAVKVLFESGCPVNGENMLKVLEYVAGTSDMPLVDINHLKPQQITIISEQIEQIGNDNEQ
jgi:hypothetical protein